MATIAINEGRATRIADYKQYSSLPGSRPAAKRGPTTIRASEARARAGVKKRQAMARSGTMTHGGGGINWGGTHNKNYKKGQFSGGGAIFGKAYSKIRAKRKSYHATPAGSSTKNWKAYKAPTDSQIRASAKRTGMQSKLTKKKKRS